MTPAQTREQFLYTIKALPEDHSPEDDFATGDEEEDAQIVADILERAEWNEWAWCVVEVTARHPDIPELEGTAYLGACSYKDAEDFKAGGYYEQMMEEAADDLDAQLERIRAVVCHTKE